ncbi:MAG: hypothetical protein LC676_08465 [Loktanella sp.]|nr:hypothetical protein [Loktanella sp.]
MADRSRTRSPKSGATISRIGAEITTCQRSCISGCTSRSRVPLTITAVAAHPSAAQRAARSPFRLACPLSRSSSAQPTPISARQRPMAFCSVIRSPGSQICAIIASQSGIE